MSSKELSEIEKYCSPVSLLIVNANGELLRLNCPFQVIVLLEVGTLMTNATAIVTEVKVDSKLILVYIINKQGYYYYNFSIIL